MATARRALAALSALAALGLVGCQTTARFAAEELTRYGRETRLLLAPVDVQLFEVTAGGLPEPKFEWTEGARRNLKAAIRAQMAGLGIDVVEYREPDSAEAERRYTQLFKLHNAVSLSLQSHEYREAGAALPTKQGKFDWTLGEGTRFLAAAYDAEYALFVWLQDSYASAGRQAVMVVSTIVLGVVPSGGVQVGTASLVDLRSGKLIWFNRIMRGTGDVRNASGARETIDTLLAKFPK